MSNAPRFELTAPRIQRSLAETITWYQVEFPWMNAVSDLELQRSRARTERAFQLLKEARNIAEASNNRLKVQMTPQWNDASALFKQIHDSLEPLGCKLRSNALEPSISFDTLRSGDRWDEAVAEVVNARRKLIGHVLAEQTVKPEDKGRFLLYYPNENLADGAAEYSSKGFFDADNVPPWDLWVDFSEGVLLSWVPLVLIDAVEMAIGANPEECILWAN